MMKLTLSFLLLILIWPPIASVTAIDVNDDPRYLAARELRNETRADWVKENELAFRKCVNKMNPNAQRVQLVVDAAHCPRRAEDRFTNAVTAATQVLVSIVNPHRVVRQNLKTSLTTTASKKKDRRPAIED